MKYINMTENIDARSEIKRIILRILLSIEHIRVVECNFELISSLFGARCIISDYYKEW